MGGFWDSIYTECVKAAVFGWKYQLYKHSLLSNHNSSKRKLWISKANADFFCLDTQSSSVDCQTKTGKIPPQVHDETRQDINNRPKGHIAHLQMTQVACQSNLSLTPKFTFSIIRG